MVTKLNYQTELNNVITKHHCITSLPNIVIKQGYIKQLCNAVTQRRDETLYRAVVLALYQAKVQRSGGLYQTKAPICQGAPGSPGARPHHTRPGPIYVVGAGAGAENGSWSCINTAGSRSKFNIKLTWQLEVKFM